MSSFEVEVEFFERTKTELEQLKANIEQLDKEMSQRRMEFSIAVARLAAQEEPTELLENLDKYKQEMAEMILIIEMKKAKETDENEQK